MIMDSLPRVDGWCRGGGFGGGIVVVEAWNE